MSDTLTELQEAILKTLRTQLPELKTCAMHPKEEDKPSQKRLPIDCPAVFVTQTELEREPSDGTPRLKLKTYWQAVSLVQGDSATERHNQARDLIVKVADIIFESRFGVRNVEPAIIERIKPYAMEDELKLVAGSWILTWTQGLIIHERHL